MWDCLFESLERSKKPEMSAGCILAHCMGLGKTLSVSYILSTAFCLKLLSSLFFHQPITRQACVYSLCVCVHMCVCACAYVCVYTCVFVCVQMFVWYMRMHAFVCMCAHAFVNVTNAHIL